MTVPVTDPFGVAADPRMPFLAAALSPAGAEARLAAACGPALGGRRLAAVRVARYKPGRRCLVEYDFGPGRSGDTALTLVGKARAKGADRASHALARALRESGFGEDSPDGVSVPEPVGLVPEFGMWLQRKVDGVPSTQLLAGAGGVALARRIAEAAHKLHRAGVPAGRRHTPADEMAVLGDRLGELARERPAWGARLERLLAACRRVAADTPPSGRCGIHRDFYPDQVLADGPRLVLLDFDLYCEGDPTLDAGNFLGHLTELGVRTAGRPDALADRERAFEDRFAELAGESCRPAVRAHAVLTLARHVALSARFPERRPFTERLLDLCEERLGLPPAEPCGREV